MENISKPRISRIKYLFGLCVFLFPILDQYTGISNHVSMGEVILILFLVILTATNKINMKMDKVALNYSVFLTVALLTSLLSGLTNFSFPLSSMIFLWIRMVLYAIIIKYAYDYSLNRKVFGNTYIAICMFLCIYLFVQYIAYYLFGRILSNYIPFLPIKSSLIDYASRNMEYVYSLSFRPSSLFSEPAKLGQYLIPCLIMLLFSETKPKHRWLMISIITAGIMLSTSFMGILVCFYVYICFFLKGKLTAKKMGLVVLAIVAFVIVVFQTDLVARNIARLSSGLSTSTGTSSAALRLLRGWEIYYRIPWLYKFIGVGLNGLQAFLSSHSIAIKYGGDYSYGEYANTLSYVLDCCGLIGFIPFVSFLKSCHSSADRIGKILVSVVIIMSFGSSFLVTPTWVLFFSIAFCGEKLLREEQYEC